MKSRCFLTSEDIEYLDKLFNYKIFLLTLLYRGSRDGWRFKDFHYKCDYLGPSITLLKIQDGCCIGGFTNAHWELSEEIKRKYDPEALLFNLTTQKSFPCLKP